MTGVNDHGTERTDSETNTETEPEEQEQAAQDREVDNESETEIPSFETGAAVVDRDKPPDERGTMRVLQEREERADERVLPMLGNQTVADVNPDHPADQPIYEVVFEGYLDDHVPEWEAWPAEELFERLRDYAAEYGVPKRTYDYPATRLTPRPTCDECDERLEYVDEPVISGFRGYFCTNEECPRDS